MNYTNKIYCSNCIYSSDVSNIEFDANGVCNYCRQIDGLKHEYGTGQFKGEELLDKILSKIRYEGQNKKYDCVIGVSGGTDSSYLLLKAREWGLRPLAVHYDNTWNSAIATMNISKVTSALNIDLYTHVVNNKEVDDIKRAFMLAGVREFDADTDIAFVQVLRDAAAKFSVRYILEGHSFVAEGLTPVGANYLDGGYVADVHNRYGNYPRVTFPNMTFWGFLKWVLLYRQKFIRPLWYIRYDKEQARKELNTVTGWKYYGGHHLENRASSYAHTVWLPQRFGIDYRYLALAADVRNGKITRETALAEYAEPVVVDPDLVLYVKKRLGLSDDDYQKIMNSRRQTWRDFKTYKRRFELLRPLFYVCAKANLVPMSFYLKYCFPIKGGL